MRAIVVYESMYGNTRLVAERIAGGLRDGYEVTLRTVSEAMDSPDPEADLVVVGGPTHVHGLSNQRTRKAASDAADKPASGLTVEPSASGPGVREWLARMGEGARGAAAAFDTRIDAPAALTGRPQRGSPSGCGAAASAWWPSPRASSSTSTTGWSRGRTSGRRHGALRSPPPRSVPTRPGDRRGRRPGPMSRADTRRRRRMALDRSFVRVALLHDGVEVARWWLCVRPHGELAAADASPGSSWPPAQGLDGRARRDAICLLPDRSACSAWRCAVRTGA